MILGVGVDIVEVKRIDAMARRHGAAFLGKVYSDAELAYCQGKRRAAEHLAARFAAKEAVLKALGTGLRGRMGWKDIEIQKGKLDEPRVKLTGAVAAQARKVRVRRIHVSLSHAETCAVAIAIAER
jgi:holo-[acyl-carrier protein] synthase